MDTMLLCFPLGSSLGFSGSWDSLQRRMPLTRRKRTGDGGSYRSPREVVVITCTTEGVAAKYL